MQPRPDIERISADSPLVDVLGGASRLQVKVHEHGFIALIDAMPRLVPEGQTADAAIVQAARVSYGQGTKKISEDRALIRYLLRHRHTTPFEMLEFKFHIAMPIFVARQWIRQRTANVNEYSGRYSIMPDQFYKPSLDNVRKQSKSNRQGGVERFVTASDSARTPSGSPTPAISPHLPNPKSKIQNPKSPDSAEDLATAQSFLAFLDRTEAQYDEYLRLTEQGVSRELARIGLPQSIYTQWYWKCDLHNILRFLSLRLDAHAQEEIRVYAEGIRALLEPIVPVTMEAWRDYEFDALHLTRLEVEAIRDGAPDLNTDNKREQAEWNEKKSRLGIRKS